MGFLQKREQPQEGGGGAACFCVFQSCVFSETVKCIASSFASLLSSICFQAALQENTFSDAFCMTSHNFQVRAALEEELCDMVECICSAVLDLNNRELRCSHCCLQLISDCRVGISYTALVSMTINNCMMETTMRLQKGETREGLQRAEIIERRYWLLKSAFWV